MTWKAEDTDRDLQLAAYFDRCAREGDMAELDADERRRLRGFLLEWMIRPGDRVLEPGCGSGRFTEVLAAAVGPSGLVVGVDLSAEMLARARGRRLPRHVRFRQASVMDLSDDEGPFDKVICLNVFPHFSDREGALRRLAGLLRPGGDLWINHFASREAINEFHAGLDPAVRDHLIPPDEEVHRLLGNTGFTIASHRQDDPGYRLHAVKAGTPGPGTADGDSGGEQRPRH